MPASPVPIGDEVPRALAALDDLVTEALVDAEQDADRAVELIADEIVDGPFKIRTLGQATWAMSHYADLTADLTDIAQVAEDARRRIAAWEDEQSARLKARRAFFDTLLMEYAVETRASTNDRTKTISTPFGVVRTTMHRPSVKVDDEEVVIAWVKRHGLERDVLKVTEKVRLSELRELIRPGDVVVGFTVVWSDGVVEEVSGSECAFAVGDAGMDEQGNDREVVDIRPRFMPAAVWTPAIGQAVEEVPGCYVEPEHLTARVEAHVRQIDA